MTFKLTRFVYQCTIFVFVLIQINYLGDVSMWMRKVITRLDKVFYNNTVYSGKGIPYNVQTLFPGRNKTQENGNGSAFVQSLVPDELSFPKYSKDVIRIVLYHPFHIVQKGYASNYNPERCVYKNCRVKILYSTSDKSVDADAVVFQGNNIVSKHPVHRDNEQVFVFQTVESPLYVHFTNLGQKDFVNYFNWTMTYRLDSDIPFPYGAVIPKYVNVSLYRRFVELNDDTVNPYWFEGTLELESFITRSYDNVMNETHGRYDHNKQNEDSVNAAKTSFNDIQVTEYIKDTGSRKGHVMMSSTTLISEDKGHSGDHEHYRGIYSQKSNDTAWLVSHCQTSSKREEYVKTMSKYIHIDIYGQCYNLTCPKNSQMECIEQIARKYKFYLAFENSVCSDYITEKAFLWFDKDIIIVVRGGRNYSRHLPKGTYIDAEDFPSPKALSEYLIKLGSNEAEYIKFLQRKDKFRVIHENERMQIAYCQLCRMLNHKDKYRKVIKDIKQWWEKPGICINRNSINIE